MSCVTSDLTAQEVRVLNSHTTPNMPVVWAIKMSSAFPFVWPVVKWKKEWGIYNGKEDLTGHHMSDGGLLSNLPVRYFVSTSPYISELRGGKVIDIDKMVCMYLDEKTAPTLSEE